MPGRLLVDEPADGVLRLTISNPHKRNALDHAILDAIAERFRALDDDVRCVVLTGAGGMFSSGYDLGDLSDEVFAQAAEQLAANAPLSVRGNKRVIRELLRAGADLDPDVERELIELRRACFRSEDLREGVRAFGEKRRARWKGR